MLYQIANQIPATIASSFTVLGEVASKKTCHQHYRFTIDSVDLRYDFFSSEFIMTQRNFQVTKRNSGINSVNTGLFRKMRNCWHLWNTENIPFLSNINTCQIFTIIYYNQKDFKPSWTGQLTQILLRCDSENILLVNISLIFVKNAYLIWYQLLPYFHISIL